MIPEAILTAGAEITAQKVLGKVLEIPEKICHAVQSECKVHHHELIVSCQNNVQQNSLAIEINHKHFNNRLKIDTGRSIRPIRLKLLSQYGEDHSDAISVIDGGFLLDSHKIAGDGVYSLRFDYPLDIKEFLDAFVDIKKAKEAPKENTTEYWMHAELKYPQFLKMKFGRLELEDMDFTVNVGISSDIKDVIPLTFKNEMESSMAVLREPNPHAIGKKAIKLAYSKRARGNKDDVMTVLSSLQKLFEADKFSNFITVGNDFRYSDCYRGIDNYGNVPFLTWPKTMSVVSKTDLNLNRCAAEGMVIYKKNDFIKEVRKVIKK